MLEQTMEAKYGATAAFCEATLFTFTSHLGGEDKKGGRRKYQEAGDMGRRQPSYQEEPEQLCIIASSIFRFHFDSGVVYGRLRKLGRVFF